MRESGRERRKIGRGYVWSDGERGRGGILEGGMDGDVYKKHLRTKNTDSYVI